MPASKRFLPPEAVKRVQRLELFARHIVEGFLSAAHRSPYFGQSVEFVQHRQYAPGDDVRWLGEGSTGIESDGLPDRPDPGCDLPEAGEAAALDRWKKLAEPYRSAARESIARVAAKPNLSNDVREVITRSLAE